jgi:adenosylcobinamide-GDP ribazoletransferase
MTRELHRFACAVQFLTRLPVRTARFEPGDVYRSAAYFPLVGQIVGAVSAGVFIVASQVWHDLIPALLAVAAGVLLTGALHEDGLADTADGLGGRDRPSRLAIMKDSRAGTYGVVALVLVLAARIAGLAQLEPAKGAVVLIAMHGVARAVMVVAMAALPYAADPLHAKVSPQPVAHGVFAIAIVLALWPFVFLPLTPVLRGLLLGCLMSLGVGLVCYRKLGGATGDVFGAIEQMCEVGFILGFTIGRL